MIFLSPFHVYTDASDLQLGAVIIQNGRPVAFYSRKLNSTQRNYTTMEKELLSIVETLNEFRTMLFGCKELHVHTDHKNLTFANLTSQRVLRWRLFLEEFNPMFHYIKGENNMLADTLSRLPRHEGENAFSITTSPQGSLELSALSDEKASTGTQSGDAQEFCASILDDQEMLECFLNFPHVDHQHPFALDYQVIMDGQQQDPALQALLQSDPQHYATVHLPHNVNDCIHTRASCSMEDMHP